MRRQGGHSQMHMAEVVLKNLKKIYPNTEKKKKKGEPEKKNDLQITDEGVVAVQDFNLHIADKEFIVLVGTSLYFDSGAHLSCSKRSSCEQRDE